MQDRVRMEFNVTEQPATDGAGFNESMTVSSLQGLNLQKRYRDKVGGRCERGRERGED